MENKNQGQVKVIDQKELKRRKKKAKNHLAKDLRKIYLLWPFACQALSGLL